MNGRERIIAAINKQAVDQVPIGPPFQGYWALGVAGITTRESIEQPAHSAAAQLAMIDSCGFDGIETMWDWMLPVEAFGCEVKMPEYGTISTWTPVVSEPADLDRIEIPDPERDYRMRSAMEATSILLDEAGSRIYTWMTILSPFTLAGEMRGIEAMMLDTLSDPGFVSELVELATEGLKGYCELIMSSGVDAVALCDPSASGSLISPTDFTRFAKGPAEEFARVAREAGGQVMVHICGDTSDRLESVLEMGADIFSIDYQVDLELASGSIGSRQTLLGNVKPAHTLFAGTAEESEQEAKECLRKTGGRNFILGAGCDIPVGSPVENVQAMKRAVLAFGDGI